MKPIIIQNSKIPQYLSIFINIYAITLYPFIISRGEMSETTINHEKIHLAQQRELWILPFYLLYIWYWIKEKMSGRTHHDSYMGIPFEIEAYNHQEDMEYLDNRKQHAWQNFISK